VEGIEEEVTMVTVARVAVCTEVETIEVATEARVCNGVGEPVMQLEALGDQQATPSSTLSVSRVSLYILYLLKNKTTLLIVILLLEPQVSDASSGHGFSITVVCDITSQR
jgi:hypothetical protein